MDNISIETDNSNNIVIMNVMGRVDSNTSPELDHALANLLQNEKDKIVVNLEQVDYLSSAGLRVLVQALKDTQKSGGNLHLATISENVEMVLRTVGMLQMFKMFSTTEEAVAGF